MLSQMLAMRSHLLPENRDGANVYLTKVWQSIVELTLAFTSEDSTDDLFLPKFMPYAHLEEERIRRNLATVKYDIDAPDTVYIVAGRGRIEKVLPSFDEYVQ